MMRPNTSCENAHCRELTKTYKDWKPYIWNSTQSKHGDDEPVVHEENEWGIELDEDEKQNRNLSSESSKKNEVDKKVVSEIGEGLKFAYQPKPLSNRAGEDQEKVEENVEFSLDELQAQLAGLCDDDDDNDGDDDK